MFNKKLKEQLEQAPNSQLSSRTKLRTRGSD